MNYLNNVKNYINRKFKDSIELVETSIFSISIMNMMYTIKHNNVNIYSYIIYIICGYISYNKGYKYIENKKANQKLKVNKNKLKNHDLFNLVWLPCIVIANILSYINIISSKEYLDIFTIYIVIDIIYVWLQLSCVPSPHLVF